MISAQSGARSPTHRDVRFWPTPVVLDPVAAERLLTLCESTDGKLARYAGKLAVQLALVPSAKQLKLPKQWAYAL